MLAFFKKDARARFGVWSTLLEKIRAYPILLEGWNEVPSHGRLADWDESDCAG
jgi:hypothetical protein